MPRQHRRKNNNIDNKKKELEDNIIRDEKGDIKIEILEKMVYSIIATNPLIYARLAKI